MSYLIDTNVLSELRRREPNPSVVQWFRARPARLMYVSVLTLGEIRKGIELETDPAFRVRLLNWFENDLPAFYQSRILNVDQKISDEWGRLCAVKGRPVALVDSLIAATAKVHRLSVVTRNVKDFNDLGVALINPWESNS